MLFGRHAIRLSAAVRRAMLMTDDKACLLQIFPIARIGFGYYLGFVNPYLRQCDTGGGKCHCHAVIFVGGDNGSAFGRAAFTLPQQDAVLLGTYRIAKFAQFGDKGGCGRSP